MFRAYCGNLDARVTEETLQNLFEEHGLIPSSIVIKRGYAFVDCPDQTSLDRAIDRLNGYNLMGSVMQVEPSTMSKRRKPIELLKGRRSNRIQIRNVSTLVTKEDLERLVATFGTVQRCDLVTSNMESTVQVTYESPDQAQRAVEQLNNYDYQSSVLKVDFMNNGNQTRPRGPRNSGTGNSRGTGYPLRILVPSELVGAIIGRKGQTIRNITTQSRARIDVDRADSTGMVEKVISIYGQPENCSNACKEILKVMQAEAASQQKGEIALKMLADDRHCGRIIGKEGKVIKKIREDTDTKITVSNVQEAPAMYPDRVITIRGTLDGMSSAESCISTKLRECYEKEAQAPMTPGMMMNPSFQSLPMMAGGGGIYGMRPPYGMMQQGQGMYGGPGGGGMYGGPNMPQQQGPPQQGPSVDVLQISVPNWAVGAIIGAKGFNIKQIIRDSNASVTVEPKKDDETTPAAERIVTIKGTPEAQWRASYFIFEKLRAEGYDEMGDVRLRTAIKVPSDMVGRIIGSRGRNVRDIQRMTGAMVQLAKDQSSQGEEAIVEITGNHLATQNAQSRIRAVISQSQQQMSGPPQRRTPRGPPPQQQPQQPQQPQQQQQAN